MPFDPEGFWLKDLSLPKGNGALPPLTREDVDRAEAFFGVKLPSTYTRLLSHRNGGYTERFVIPINADLAWYGEYLDIDHLNGIGPRPANPPDYDDYADYDIYKTPYMIREWGLPEKQVLLSGDGHTWIALDYRHGGEPMVTWLDNDPHNDQVICGSFEEFLEKLIPESIAIDPATHELKPEFNIS
jgi:SMI1-KNR4 cell-wall